MTNQLTNDWQIFYSFLIFCCYFTRLMTREIICKTWNNRDCREIFAISHLYFDIQLISWPLLKVLFSLVSIWNAEGWGTRNLKSLLVNVLLFHKKRSKWFTLSLINSVSCNVHLLSSQEPLSKRTSIPKCYFFSITINTLRHECSPVNFLHIFRTSFPKSTSWWLPLSILLF